MQYIFPFFISLFTNDDDDDNDDDTDGDNDNSSKSHYLRTFEIIAKTKVTKIAIKILSV